MIHCKTQEEANVLCDNFGASQQSIGYMNYLRNESEL